MSTMLEHKNEVDVYVFETECDNCGSTWDDYYKLVGHGNLKRRNKHNE
jgi:hypothetical protein